MRATLKTIDFSKNKTTNHKGFIEDVERWITNKKEFLKSIYQFSEEDFMITRTDNIIILHCHRPKRQGTKKEMNFSHIITIID